jgi:Mn2+/Fe2+ NRAMP family transporter
LILIPGAPLLRILVLSQVANGVWLPIVLIFMIKLINRRDLMGDQVNSRIFNAIAWLTSICMIVLTFILIYASIFRPGGVPGM